MTEFAGLSTTRLSYFKALKKVVKSLDEHREGFSFIFPNFPSENSKYTLNLF